MGSLKYDGPATVKYYSVARVQYCTDTLADDDHNSADSPVILIVIRFSFSRNLVGAIMNNFLPIVICTVIGYSTIYYDNFEVSAGTNLTLLLVLVTL